jgi:Rieske Fe-S protein
VKLSTYFSLLNRRQWLKVLVLGTIAQTAFGKPRSPGKGRRAKSPTGSSLARSTALAAPSAPAPTVAPDAQPLAALLTPGNYNSAIIPIRISDFPVLGQIGGSASIYFSNLRNPMIINRADTAVFHALDSTCTHQQCPVGIYGNPVEFYMHCDCHDSLYTIEGKVAQGPAQFDLFTFPSRFDGNDLIEIELVGVPLRIDRVTLQSSTPGNTRLMLDFPGIAGSKYTVQYYADLTAPPQPALFALSATGPADQASFTVPDYIPGNPLSGDGSKALWVDAPGTTGFFTIEMALGSSVPL